MSRIQIPWAALATALLIVPAVAKEPASSPKPVAAPTPPATTTTNTSDQANAKNWRSLFNGKNLEGWKISNFYGECKVFVEDGMIIMNPSVFMAGVTATQEIPDINYEVSLQAQRVEGSDFFCGLTFPVKEDFCSLIVGGWGGGVVGLSSINGMDASQNQTTVYREFENDLWYPIKLRVTAERITAWIDGQKIVDVDIEGKELSTRLEVEWSKPFGIATYSTTGAIRDLKIRKLPPEEVQAVNAVKLDPYGLEK